MEKQDQEMQEKIESYISGELSKEEEVALEILISKDEELQDRVLSLKEIRLAFEGAQIRSKLQQIHDQEQQQKKTGVDFKWGYGIAATVALFLVVWWLIPVKPSNERLFTEYFKPFPDLISSRGNASDDFANGMLKYTSGDYENAIRILKDNLGNRLSSDTDFYLALSYLGDQKMESANRIFESMSKEDSKYGEQINWYWGLSYLRQADTENATKKFQMIKEGEYKYKEAAEILSDL